MIRDNIQNTEIFCIMKNEYENKLQKLRKDLAYYRDSNTKNEQLVKEAEKFKQKKLIEEQKQEEYIFAPRKIQVSNPTPISGDENMSEEEENGNDEKEEGKENNNKEITEIKN